jgi:hypothetical protein
MQHFISGYTVDGKKKYAARIHDMCAYNRSALVVDYDDIAAPNGEQHIAYFLPEAPVEVRAVPLDCQLLSCRCLTTWTLL